MKQSRSVRGMFYGMPETPQIPLDPDFAAKLDNIREKLTDEQLYGFTLGLQFAKAIAQETAEEFGKFHNYVGR